MNINSRNIYIIYFFFYFSLLIGFYFDENFAGGYIADYSFHKYKVVPLFEENFIKSFLNFDNLGEGTRLTSHSPIYIIFFLFVQKISFSENFSRLIGLHLSLLIPYFFYLSLKLKYKFKINNIKILLPAIIFFSPYFRSASIWLADENLSLIFLSICFYFFLKFEDSKKKKLSDIFLNILFLALAAYMRPIYSLFSIYFFVRYYFDLNFSPKLLFCIFLNILLSFPAIYYIFVLDINQWFSPLLFTRNFITLISIIITIFFFYSIPFLLTNIKQNFQISNFKIKHLVFSIIFLFLLIFYFDYNLTYGGGIFFKLSILIFGNNYLFYIFSLISLNVFILIFFDSIKSKDTIFDLVLLLTLFLLDIDGVFYHETYDPLLYFIYFLFVKNKIYSSFTKKLTNKKLILLSLFSISFFVLSVLKTIHNPIETPIYYPLDRNLSYNMDTAKSIY